MLISDHSKYAKSYDKCVFFYLIVIGYATKMSSDATHDKNTYIRPRERWHVAISPCRHFSAS